MVLVKAYYYVHFCLCKGFRAFSTHFKGHVKNDFATKLNLDSIFVDIYIFVCIHLLFFYTQCIIFIAEQMFNLPMYLSR